MAEKESSYKSSLNLPKTDLAMKANLVQREPERERAWQQAKLYERLQKKPAPRGRYFLHDGPPYANGDIHMGHLINKVLKDIVVKYRAMAGYHAPYIPGWDCHGLPIEHKVMLEIGPEVAALPRLDVRKRCLKYANKFVKLQGDQFQRLGVFGDFAQPYLTTNPPYEGAILECLARFVERGLVYRQKKPIHWSYACRTALAEAELEYEDIVGPSIYVTFPASADAEKLVPQRKPGEPLNFMIWTTTPWTLPANLAIMVGPDYKYVAVRYEFNGESQISFMAADLFAKVLQVGGIEKHEVLAELSGRDLVGKHYAHPFVNRTGVVIESSEYVTLEDGSGLVHCAPGHGQEDYVVGLRNGLEPYSPVDDAGKFDETVPDWLRGQFVFDANPVICERLKDLGCLFHLGQLTHSYPHCWRSKTPVIYRATEQWFIAVDKPMDGRGPTLRRAAIDAVKKVQWIPGWGENRIMGMLESRPDWCISRQRSWGVPIPAFYCPKCKVSLMTAETVRKVSDHFARKGSDSWFRDSTADILGDLAKCPQCGGAELEKESDILDVWFESGSSWLGGAAGRPEQDALQAPVELYLEGSDQHRGWFQSSLLIGVGATDRAPFKTVLTHGFVVDEKGYKMSKSLGNVVNVQDEVKRLGADVLRLWVSSVDYQYDIRTSEKLIDQLQDAYRKIRNTFRFLLGNLADFDPARDAVPVAEMDEADRWILAEAAEVVEQVTAAYEKFEFHPVYQLVHGFCVNELSSFYLDVQKDAMYCDAVGSRRRRSGQTAMYLIAHRLVRLLAPVLAHSADEIWSHVPGVTAEAEFVHLADWPVVEASWKNPALLEKWRSLLAVRSAALVKLEALRSAGTIQSNMEAALTLSPTSDQLAALLAGVGEAELTRLFIVSSVKLAPDIGGQADEGSALAMRSAATRSSAAKCARCWNLRDTVGRDAKFANLCDRCASVMATK